MSNRQPCPVCRPNFSGVALVKGLGDSLQFQCNVCGTFVATNTVLKGPLDREDGLSVVERSVLVNKIRMASISGLNPDISTQTIKDIIGSAALPGAALQSRRIIELIGNKINITGDAAAVTNSDFAYAGCLNRNLGKQLIRDLLESKLIYGGQKIVHIDEILNEASTVPGYLLTLSGWEEFESLKSGKFEGNYAFIAMKFGDDVLDPFVNSNVKDALRGALGFEVVDLRDVSRAGVIDNLMRAQIRDSAFVLVDLSHDNSGAYWEAGYAEGLGKPVIYLCEKNKFEETKTHFDTNHCTTVIWEEGDPDSFKNELIATVRRSIGYLEGRSQ